MTNGLFPEPGAPERVEPPVPPLRLRRIRLHGVGPDGARFDPLDLDFATDDGAASRVLLCHKPPSRPESIAASWSAESTVVPAQ